MCRSYINVFVSDVCQDFCDNGGECVKDARGEPSCRCTGSFTGRHCRDKSEFAYIASGVAGGVIFIIFLVLLVWMICARFVFRELKISSAFTLQEKKKQSFF